MSEIYEKLSAVNVNDKVETHMDLKYLSWAYAWRELTKLYPDANYTILKDDKNRCYFGNAEIGYMVYTQVTAGGKTHEMCLPILNTSFKSLKLAPYTYKTKYGQKTVEAITIFDINKAVMRCLVKNIAMFGLGLYIYEGEDLPEQERVTEQDLECLHKFIKSNDYPTAFYQDILKKYKVKDLEQLTLAQIHKIMKKK